MKKKMKKEHWIALLIICFFVLGIALLLLDQYAENEKAVDIEESLVYKQQEEEQSFSAEGYSLESPKVILNPYENSPLTALILFETDQEVAPEVTIVGKDDLSTYHHTFSSAKEHYLPIYGLYADYENTVRITCNDQR